MLQSPLKKGSPLFQDSKGHSGAGDGDRTRDPKLGKLVLYHLSYTRKRPHNHIETSKSGEL